MQKIGSFIHLSGNSYADMEVKMNATELVKENARLQAENARLKREIEIEERVTLRWKALAGIFHDTLWSALRRYDPPVYEKLRKEKCTCDKVH